MSLYRFRKFGRHVTLEASKSPYLKGPGHPDDPDNYGFLARLGVNWSCFGATTPAVARRMARDILRACDECDRRAKIIRAMPRARRPKLTIGR